MCNWNAIQKQYGFLISAIFLVVVVFIAVAPTGYLVSGTGAKPAGSYPGYGYGYGTFGGAQAQTVNVVFSPSQTKYTVDITPYSEKPLNVKIDCSPAGYSVSYELYSDMAGVVSSTGITNAPYTLSWNGKNQAGNKDFVHTSDWTGTDYTLKATCWVQELQKGGGYFIWKQVASKTATVQVKDTSVKTDKSATGNSETFTVSVDKVSYPHRATMLVRRQTGTLCQSWVKYKISAVDRNGQVKYLGTTNGLTADRTVTSWGAVSATFSGVDPASLKAEVESQSDDSVFKCRNIIEARAVVYSKPSQPVTAYQLVVRNAEMNRGSVQSTSPSSLINCGFACTARPSAGSTVTLVAKPSAGYQFAGWTGACTGASTTCTISINSDKDVTAKFTPITGGGGGGGGGSKGPLMQ